jgi:CDP-diacylglycerol--glycerol-3-phosphate 3-phosphatidyltransferase/archaetidylinositol phosphate synthase
MLGKLRERYQKAMMPIGQALAKTGITPNIITGLTLIVALVSTYFFYLGDLLIGLGFMVFTVIMDMFDGAVARAANLISKFGATLDHTLDRYAEFFFILGLMIGPSLSSEKFVHWFWGVFALFGMVMASFTRAKAESVGGMESCTVGIAERQEKLLLTAIGILLVALPASNIWLDFLAFLPVSVGEFMFAIKLRNALTVCIALVGILSHITVIQRLVYARKIIGDSEQTEYKAGQDSGI